MVVRAPFVCPEARSVVRNRGHGIGLARARGPIAPLLVISLVAAALVGGCGPGRNHASPELETAEGRFPHSKHRRLACAGCHDVAAVREGRPATPGADQHAPCDQSGCHREQFLSAPGPLCKICHSRVDPTGELSSDVVYPPQRGPRFLASAFSHVRHLDYGRMERAVGFHVSCTDCHAGKSDALQGGVPGQLRHPEHGVCSRCHAVEAAPRDAPTMLQCTACHRARGMPPSRTRQVVTGDLHFSHDNHRRDRTGGLIKCTECHPGAAQVGGVSRHIPPSTRACVECHDDSARVPSGQRMSLCETCHRTRSKTLAQLPPRSHLPAPRRPDDHTLAFRRDHGVEAQTSSRECARCHDFMSGSPRDACDQCHKVMRPTDHVISWREYEHGPSSRSRTERCATCHQADFCVSCHQRPPRSHFPRTEFRQRGHASIARFDYRACVTCHQPERDCTSAGCHTVRPRP